MTSEYIIEQLREEIIGLQEKLSVIRLCEDKKCSLCKNCLNAVLPDRPPIIPPKIAEDDPIRNTGHIWPRGGNTYAKRKYSKNELSRAS